MEEFPVVEVRRNDHNGQKLITVPKDCEIYEDHKVRLQDLGKHRDKIPDYLKLHQDVEHLMYLCIDSKQLVDEDLEEVRPHLEDAANSLSKAMNVIEENKAVYADMTTEEIQESCPHPSLITREKGGWKCKNCKKVLHLQGE